MTPTTIRAGDPVARIGEFRGWLRDHLIDPNLTYEVTVYHSEIVVRQYALDERGEFHISDGDAAVSDPFTVPVKSPCPLELG